MSRLDTGRHRLDALFRGSSKLEKRKQGSLETSFSFYNFKNLPILTTLPVLSRLQCCPWRIARGTDAVGLGLEDLYRVGVVEVKGRSDFFYLQLMSAQILSMTLHDHDDHY